MNLWFTLITCGMNCVKTELVGQWRAVLTAVSVCHLFLSSAQGHCCVDRYKKRVEEKLKEMEKKAEKKEETEGAEKEVDKDK